MGGATFRYATLNFLPVEYFRKDTHILESQKTPKRGVGEPSHYCYTLVPTQGVGGCKIVENILVPCRLKYIPGVGGCKIVENILVPCRLKYIPGVGGCKIVESILVPCRLKYIPGGGWVSKA